MLYGLKGHKASFAEDEIARHVLEKLPMAIYWCLDDDARAIDEIIEVGAAHSPSDQAPHLQIGAELAAYAAHICHSPADKSKRYQKRLTGSIRLLNELQHYYRLQGHKDIYWANTKAKDQDVQFFALDGLADYYQQHDESLTAAEQKALRRIIDRTDNRDTASTCCQVLINAGVMDELEAVVVMDDWKDKHWGR